MMHKRIILFVLGLAVAVGIFWAYQALTGSSFLLTRRPPTVHVSPLEKDRPLTVEMRRPDGGLIYVLNAKKAEPTKDAAGAIIQGQYTLTEPSASYHTSDERLVVIRADSGTLSIDQLGTAAKPKPVPRGGKLSGNVILTIGPKESFYDNSMELKAGQIQARLEKDLEFDYNDRVLSSSGGIQVRGERVAFDGKKMTLAFNMDEKRIEFLRIDEGNKIIIKNIGAEGFGLKPKELGVAETQKSPAVVTTGPAVAATEPSKKAGIAPTTYKLSFGKDVKASVGARSLTSEHLYVLFMVATQQVADESGKPAKVKGEGKGEVSAGGAATEGATTERAPTTMIAANPAATQLVIPPVPAFPKEGEDDLVVTWTGPMEMRPSGPTDLVLSGNRDAALEAVGTVERPVVVKDGTGNGLRTATAGRMWFHAGAQRLELEKGDLAGVMFSDPTLGNAKCAGMTFVQTGEGTSTIKLAGPGSVEVLQGAVRRASTPAAVEAARKLPPVVATWGKEMALDLVTVADGKGRSTPMVKRGVLTGDATVGDASFSLGSKELEFAIASTGDVKTPAAFEKLVAKGNVEVRVSRGGSGLKEEDKPDGLSAKELVLLTTVGAGSKVPVVSEMVATGDVVGWSYTPTRGEGAGAKGADAKLNRQQIMAPKLDVLLAAREGSGGSAGADNFGGSQVKQMVASEGAKVDLEGFGGVPVSVWAQTLTADPREGRAMLEGVLQANGVMKMARLQQGENQILGAKMMLDQKAQSLEIPGDGSFVFVQPGQKAGEAGTPVRVTWSKGMSYNGKDLLATFNGVVKAEMVGKEDQYSYMTCDDLLTVKLAQEKGEAVAGAGEVAAGKVRLSEIVAKGNVKAEGASLGADKKPVTRVFMQAPKLVYTEATKTMSIPSAGSLLVEDYRVDPKARPEGKGQTAFGWGGSLTYVGTTGEITFKKDVRMVHVPAKPFRTAGMGTDGKAVKPEDQRIDLNCDVLTAVMVQSKEAGGGETVASPVALGSGGNQKLAKVTANGGSVLTMGDKELSAAELEFDAVGQKAIASGKDGSWATFSSGGGVEGRGEADQIIWEMTKDNAITLIRPRGNVSTPN